MAKTKEIDQEISELEKKVALLKEKKEKLKNPNLLTEYIKRKIEAKTKAESIVSELTSAIRKLDKFYTESKEMVPPVSFEGLTYGSGNTRYNYSVEKFKKEADDLGSSVEELEKLLEKHGVTISKNNWGYGRDGWVSSSENC